MMTPDEANRLQPLCDLLLLNCGEAVSVLVPANALKTLIEDWRAARVEVEQQKRYIGMTASQKERHLRLDLNRVTGATS